MPRCAQCAHQTNLLRFRGHKALIHIQNRHNQRNGKCHHDNGADTRPHPNNKNRAKSRFGQCVEHHQIRIQNPRERVGPPHGNGNRRAQKRAEDKAHHGFQTRCADVQPQIAALAEIDKGRRHAAGTADEETVGQAHPGDQLPNAEQRHDQRDLPDTDLTLVPLLPAQIGAALRGRRNLIHGYPAPSI